MRKKAHKWIPGPRPLFNCPAARHPSLHLRPLPAPYPGSVFVLMLVLLN
ncbi:MAG: hypothetical protein M8349_04935 [ANME-2 cluster archaeon]|nr:hypothetical protein [ANME-2 cluster archaeon]